MLVQTFTHSLSAGWSEEAFPALDSDHTLVLVFGAAVYDGHREFLHEIVASYPRSLVTGCSTAGEINGTTIADESLSVVVVRFDHTQLRRAVSRIETADRSFAAGAEIGRQLAGDCLAGVLLFSEGLQVNGTDLVRGLNSILPHDVLASGGLAGDGNRFEHTWVLHDGEPVEGIVCAVGLYGDRVTLAHGTRGGWDIFGPERRVTRSSGNTLFELDGRPALALYKEYLGDRASGLPATALLFPLALRSGNGGQKQIVRTVLAVDEATQSMTFAGDIPERSLAQLMRANFDRLIDGASDAAQMAVDVQRHEAPGICIAITCVGRRLVLGERAEEEIEAIREILPPSMQQVGFYSYGELSPDATGQCVLHNQTMTLTTIVEF